MFREIFFLLLSSFFGCPFSPCGFLLSPRFRFPPAFFPSECKQLTKSSFNFNLVILLHLPLPGIVSFSISLPRLFSPLCAISVLHPSDFPLNLILSLSSYLTLVAFSSLACILVSSPFSLSHLLSSIPLRLPSSCYFLPKPSLLVPYFSSFSKCHFFPLESPATFFGSSLDLYSLSFDLR